MSSRLSPALSPAHTVLHDVFGYEQFRGPQQAIVEHVIAGGDALVSLLLQAPRGEPLDTARSAEPIRTLALE